MPAVAAASEANQTTTLDDQTELSVTVYNSNIALVRDVRSLSLAQGTSDLHFMDIAATVNPATVHFRSLTEPSRVSVLEQNYEYDLLEPEKLLRKYVGRDVTLIRLKQDQNSTREEVVKARLLSYNNGPVWQIDGEIVTVSTPTTSGFRNCREISTHGRRSSGRSRTAARLVTASRRRTWPASSPGMRTTS